MWVILVAVLNKIIANLKSTLSIWCSRQLFVFLDEVARVRRARPLYRPGGYIERPLSLELPTTHHPHNGCIIRQDAGYLVAARAVNYGVSRLTHRLIVPGGPAHVDSQNWLVRLDRDLRVREVTQVNDVFCKQAGSLAQNGLEDPRLFTWRGRLHALWSAGRVGSNVWDNISNTMAIGVLHGRQIEGLRFIESPHGRKREKNWMPWVVGDELRLVYSVPDMETYRYEDGKLTPLHKSAYADPRLRGYSGGSPLQRWGDDWMCAVHCAARATRQATAKLVRFFYIHRLIVVTDDFRIKAVSREFFLEHKGAEFCAGLSVEDDGIILSYSARDCTSNLMKVPNAVVRGLFD